ncbi:alpha/beta-hydrolase [Ascodesmis nigricans]|uniref:Alpha/beta-hydrolase n=1 Tax=Ascodesmis nigricans TaxID=341454 RepID=A0A4S2N360_9PEZI|nr:alpha/beta-hydrolase [Ascodesmis nigricans]
MHGLFGSKQNHRSISKALAKDLNTPVYALDLRNHGDSPHVKRHDYLSMASDVTHFINSHNLESPILVGHSMGAKTAMAVALQHPSLVSRIIVVDNAPVEAGLASSFPRYIQAMRKIEDSKLTKQAEADEILENYGGEKSLAVRQFLLTNLTRTHGSNVLRWRVPVQVLQNALDNMGGFPFHPDKERFEKPALFVRGTMSHYVPDETIPIIGRFFPLFRMKDIESGHWVISEKPHDFKDAVIEFMTPDE